MEFYFSLDKLRMAEENIGAGRLFFRYPSRHYGRNMEIGSVTTEEGTEKIKIVSPAEVGRKGCVGNAVLSFSAGGKEHKLPGTGNSGKRADARREVAKENQQYRLYLQYEYISSSEQGHKL